MPGDDRFIPAHDFQHRFLQRSLSLIRLSWRTGFDGQAHMSRPQENPARAKWKIDKPFGIGESGGRHTGEMHAQLPQILLAMGRID
jgi:hypothetical protein